MQTCSFYFREKLLVCVAPPQKINCMEKKNRKTNVEVLVTINLQTRAAPTGRARWIHFMFHPEKSLKRTFGKEEALPGKLRE